MIFRVSKRIVVKFMIINYKVISEITIIVVEPVIYYNNEQGLREKKLPPCSGEGLVIVYYILFMSLGKHLTVHVGFRAGFAFCYLTLK